MALTVLVVDDYADARLLLSYQLEDAGFLVLHAEDGPQAIIMARKHQPAAILMDLGLPGMSGLEATQRLRADSDVAAIPVVAYTLSPRPLSDEERGLFDAVLRKPSPPETLNEALHQVIRARKRS